MSDALAQLIAYGTQTDGNRALTDQERELLQSFKVIPELSAEQHTEINELWEEVLG